MHTLRMYQYRCWQLTFYTEMACFHRLTDKELGPNRFCDVNSRRMDIAK